MTAAGENADLVRRMLALVSERGVEEALSFIHHDCEMVVGADMSAEPDTYRGHDGARRYFAGFAGALEEVRFEPLEVEEHGHAVLATIRMSARGERSGLEMDQIAFAVVRVLDGQVRLIDLHPDMAAARAAAARSA